MYRSQRCLHNMSSKLKENTCANQPSVARYMSPGSQQKRKVPSESESPSEKISPPKKRSAKVKMGDSELAIMEKRISENVTSGLKKDMRKMMEESMKDTMKEMIDNSLKGAIDSMNAASKRMEECSTGMMNKTVEINALVEENIKLNMKVSKLETEQIKLSKKIKQMEERSLDSNLIIRGIPETKWEKEYEIKALMYNELSKTIVAKNENERQEIVRKIGIRQCKRLGKYTEGQNRPLSVEFLLKEDAVYLLENRTNLRKGIYIDREYSADVEYQRRLLRPILQAARRTKGFEKKCKLQGASLEIKGKKITTKTLHKLPKELDVFTITSKKHDNVIGFFGELNALSNFHPAEFEIDGIKFPTSEHYIQYTKAIAFGDNSTAANILGANTPSDSKSLGWTVANFDKEKWDKSAKTLCQPGLREKFHQNKHLLDTLLRTKDHILVESAKDNVWGTGIALARDDWYDDTLWHSQGILGEMLCEIRDNYLRNHPETVIQELIYKSEQPTPPDQGRLNSHFTSSRDILTRSTSQPELGSLIGVPNPTNELGSTPNLVLQPQSSSNSSVSIGSPKGHELHGAPSLPDVNTSNISVTHSVQSETTRELRGVSSDLHSSAEPMDACEAIQMTPTQARLVSISQAEH